MKKTKVAKLGQAFATWVYSGELTPAVVEVVKQAECCGDCGKRISHIGNGQDVCLERAYPCFKRADVNWTLCVLQAVITFVKVRMNARCPLHRDARR